MPKFIFRYTYYGFDYSDIHIKIFESDSKESFYDIVKQRLLVVVERENKVVKTCELETRKTNNKPGSLNKHQKTIDLLREEVKSISEYIELCGMQFNSFDILIDQNPEKDRKTTIFKDLVQNPKLVNAMVVEDFNFEVLTLDEFIEENLVTI